MLIVSLFYLLGITALIVFVAMVYNFTKIKSPFSYGEGEGSGIPQWKKNNSIVNENRKYLALSLKLLACFLLIIGLLFLIVYQIECIGLSPKQCFLKL